MKNVKKIIATALVGILAVSAVGCKMIGKTEAAIKKSPVAKVNKDTITRGELDEQMKQVIEQLKMQGIDPASQQGKDLLKQQQQQVLDNMIMNTIIKQKATELKVVPEKAKLDEEVNKKIDEIKKNYQDEAKFNEALKTANLTIEQLKSLISDEVIKEKVRNKVIEGMKIEDAKVKEYYDMYSFKYTEKPNKIHLAHILTKTEDEAKKARDRVVKGEDFAKVAKEMSIDTAANEKGGDLGEVPYVDSGMDETFMKAAMLLSKGVVSLPVKTQFGFHIIKCIDKIEYPVKKFEAVKEEITTTLLTEAQDKKVTDTLAQWKKDAKIETKKYEKNLE